ncbi:hypothetical protein CM15mP37_08870 [bacterium]|nr:MAG: hypothetical protein CM15mP37_08870 [bacterium]
MKKVFLKKNGLSYQKITTFIILTLTSQMDYQKSMNMMEKKAQGFGLFENNTLIAFYSYESDLGDGWEDQEVHNNPYEIRLNALRMGTNIIWYSMVR